MQPESGPDASSRLPGASNLVLQDLCGPLHLAEHFKMVVDTAAFGAAFATLELGRPATKADFDTAYCSEFKDNILTNFTNIPGTSWLPLLLLFADPSDCSALLQSTLNDLVTFGVAARVRKEPLLQPYVCARGYADPSKCGPAGFVNNYA